MPPQPTEENLTQVDPKDTSSKARARWLAGLFPNLREAAIRWSEDDAGSLAASVAYYLALSLFPMLLLLTSVFGLILQFTKIGQDSQVQLLDTVAQHGSPVIQEQVAQVLNQLKSHSLVGGPFGILMAILAAIGVFCQLDRGFDRIWRIQPVRGKNLTHTALGVLRDRLLAFTMLLGLGGMLVGLFIAGTIFSQFRTFAGSTVPLLSPLLNWLQTLFIVTTNAILFGMVYKWVPKKTVGWTEALRGGFLAAIVWELGRVVLGFFLIGMRYTSAYGVIGSFIAILLWCYYGMSIVFFGAEYVQVLQRKRQLAATSINTVAVNEDSTFQSLHVEESYHAPSEFFEPSEGEYLRKISPAKVNSPKTVPHRVG